MRSENFLYLGGTVSFFSHNIFGVGWGYVLPSVKKYFHFEINSFWWFHRMPSTVHTHTPHPNRYVTDATHFCRWGLTPVSMSEDAPWVSWSNIACRTLTALEYNWDVWIHLFEVAIIVIPNLFNCSSNSDTHLRRRRRGGGLPPDQSPFGRIMRQQLENQQQKNKPSSKRRGSSRTCSLLSAFGAKTCFLMQIIAIIFPSESGPKNLPGTRGKRPAATQLHSSPDTDSYPGGDVSVGESSGNFFFCVCVHRWGMR